MRVPSEGRSHRVFARSVSLLSFTRDAPTPPEISDLAVQTLTLEQEVGRVALSPHYWHQPRTPIHGPFSANFDWVTLEDRKDRHIDLTDGQARMFKVLWDFKGKPIHRDRLIARANLPQDSKPVDAFKVRARNKQSEIHHERLRAYRTLVHTTKQGEYSLPCAAEKR